MNMRLNVAIQILDDLNPYSNEKKQCADELLYKFWRFGRIKRGRSVQKE